MGMFDKFTKAATDTFTGIGNAVISTEVGRTAVRGIEQGAEALGGVVLDGANATGNAFNSLSNEVEEGIDKARRRLDQFASPVEFVRSSRIPQFLDRFGRVVEALAISSAVLVERTSEIAYRNVHAAARGKRVDSDVLSDLSLVLDDERIQNAIRLASEDNLFTLTLGFGGDAAFIVGAQGMAGFAVPIPNVQDSRLFGAAGGSLGFQAGGGGEASLGLWFQPVSELAGSYFEIGVEGSFEAGAGVQVALDLVNLDVAGFLVVPSAGSADLSVALSAGYTWLS